MTRKELGFLAILAVACGVWALHVNKEYVSDGHDMRRGAFSTMVYLEEALDAYLRSGSGPDSALLEAGDHSFLLFEAALQQASDLSELGIKPSEIVERGLHKLVLDPWGNPYTYRIRELGGTAEGRRERRHAVYSWGPNGTDDFVKTFDSGDDIGWWWREDDPQRHELSEPASRTGSTADT